MKGIFLGLVVLLVILLVGVALLLALYMLILFLTNILGLPTWTASCITIVIVLLTMIWAEN